MPTTPRFVLQWEDSFTALFLSIDAQGAVSGRFLEGFADDGVIGSPVAVDDDLTRFVLNVDTRLLVLRSDGASLIQAVHRAGPVHDSGPVEIQPPLATTGAVIAAGPDQARFAGRMMDRRIFIVDPAGGVLGYDYIPDGDGAIIQPPFAFGGARVATDADVRFVVGMFFQIVLVRSDGSVVSHLTDAQDNILEPVVLSGPKIELSPDGGDFVVAMGTSNSFTPGPQFSLVVVRSDGSVVAHAVTSQTIAPAVTVAMQPPG